MAREIKKKKVKRNHKYENISYVNMHNMHL